MNNQAALALALQELPATLALVPELIAQVKHLEQEVTQLKGERKTGWVTIKDGAKSIGLTTEALRQKIIRTPLPQDEVWKQSKKGASIFVHVERLKECIE
jgi:hypothetical protein